VNLAAGASTGDFVSLKDFHLATIIFIGDNGLAGEDIVLTLREAKDAAGTGVQDLAKISKVWKKQATNVQTVGSWTEVSQTVAATFTDTDSGENEQIFVFEVRDDDLSDGFTHIQCNINDPGATAKLATVLYLLSEPRYGGRASTMPSVIA
jgi:hypothetical protein